MKATSTITTKYPGHNTQKTTFRLCALPLGTLHREVDVIVDSKLTEGYRHPAKYVIHTIGPVWHGDKNGEVDILASCYHRSPEITECLGRPS